MTIRGLFAAVAAIVLGAMLIQTAHAYPTYARSGITTVTGVYRPLDLNLQLDDSIPESSEFFYDPGDSSHQTFAYTGKLTGTFSSTYGASGTAGNWTLNLGFNTFNTANNIVGNSDPLLNGNVLDSDDGEDTITLRITAADRPVGTLVYDGGLLATSGTLPIDGSDSPEIGDMFLLYAHNAGAVLHVTVDDILDPTYFYLALAQQLLHVGPYVVVSENLYDLDDGSLAGSAVSRVNEDCAQGTRRCGSVPVNGFFASSVEGATFIPEPASLALVGLGLIGIALGRRHRQSRPKSA